LICDRAGNSTTCTRSGGHHSHPRACTTECGCWTIEKELLTEASWRDASEPAQSAQIRAISRARSPSGWPGQPVWITAQSTRLWVRTGVDQAVSPPGPGPGSIPRIRIHLSRRARLESAAIAGSPRSNTLQHYWDVQLEYRIDLLPGGPSRRPWWRKAAGPPPGSDGRSSLTLAAPFEGEPRPRTPGLITMSPRRPSTSVRRADRGDARRRRSSYDLKPKWKQVLGLHPPAPAGLQAGQMVCC